jgi:hypothetical protein
MEMATFNDKWYGISTCYLSIAGFFVSILPRMTY